MSVAGEAGGNRFGQLPDYPFVRLRALLGREAPGLEPISLSIGEPQHPFPEFVAEVLAREAAGYGRYPPMEGTDAFRDAVAGWLTRRYRLPAGAVDPKTNVIALNGTREGLFGACLAVTPERKNGTRPAVLMPNPFYQCYAGAALAAGAEPIYVPALRENRFLPDYAALPPDLLARTAAVYLCSPTNPQGTCATLEDWKALITLARTHGFALLADECYAEIYDGAPPAGALEAAHALGGFDNVLAFHSLSKRSSLPGLRSGFVAGDAKLVAAFLALRQYGGAASPLPVLAAAAAAWSEDGHVEVNRARYRRKFDIAENILSNRFSFYRPGGGFYLWLDVGDGEAAALKLWREAGVRVLPGRYLAVGGVGADGCLSESANNQGPSPGDAFIRAALVADEDTTATALRRIAECL